MAALTAGVRAPDFTLPTVDGKDVSLREALTKGPVLLAFFKVSCPVCPYALPFVERLYRANQSANITVFGISQDNVRDTKAFAKEYGISFPLVLDNPADYAVSNAYGLTNVPTIFYIAADGEIEISSVSWSKADIETMNEKLATVRRQTPAVLWRKGDDVRDFRAG
jgi:peroxiredoxin